MNTENTATNTKLAEDRTLIAMVGLPRSGKSTITQKLSKELQAPIVSKDNIRLALHGRAYETLAEPFVKAISKVMVHSLFLSGHRVVIADETHYSRAARTFMADGPWTTRFYVVPTSAEICSQRAIDTGQSYLLPVIKEMVARWEPLEKDELEYKGYAFNPAVSCDKCASTALDFIDKQIFHKNDHVWPGYAWETY